jgi:hypothetical protein
LLYTEKAFCFNLWGLRFTVSRFIPVLELCKSYNTRISKIRPALTGISSGFLKLSPEQFGFNRKHFSIQILKEANL